MSVPTRDEVERSAVWARDERGSMKGIRCADRLLALLAEVERLRTEREEDWNTLRNFFGDISIKRPIGRAIGEIIQLRKRVKELEE